MGSGTTLDDIRMRTATSKASCSTTSHPGGTSAACGRAVRGRPRPARPTTTPVRPHNVGVVAAMQSDPPPSLSEARRNLPDGRADVRAREHRPCRTGVTGLTPHMLRHTAASLAIASGANVKVVQQMLGHKSATMTLDLYGHPFGDQLDIVSDALDAARRASDPARVAPVLPKSQTVNPA